MTDALDGMVIDLFCGGGGASTGIRAALGRDVDLAVDYWAPGLTIHTTNHPGTRHVLANVWAVDPRAHVGGRRVQLLWLSPPCTDFSRAKSTGSERSSKTRSLPWVAVRWARAVRPEVIIMENVPEMLQWGPLDHENKPIRSKIGKSFRCFVGKLEKLGYVVETRVLVAADYGAPTMRKRMFLIARCDGKPIEWPTPTHGPTTSQPHRSAAEVIRWDIEGTSIFGRKKPLVPATLRRIATGLQRFVIDSKAPFVVDLPSGKIVPTMVQNGYKDRENQTSRSREVTQPLNAIVSSAIKECVVTAHLDSAYGTSRGNDVAEPMPSVTADGGGKVSVVTGVLHIAFVQKCTTDGIGVPMTDPHLTITANSAKHGTRKGGSAPVGLVEWTLVKADSRPPQSLVIESFVREHRRLYKGQDPATHPCVPRVIIGEETFYIIDVKARMLLVEELFLAQGFPRDYRMVAPDGAPVSKTHLVTVAGNAVCPPMAEALVRSQLR